VNPIFKDVRGNTLASGLLELSAGQLLEFAGVVIASVPGRAVAKRTTMTKVEAIIQVSRLDAVKDALHDVGVEGLTVFEARGHGRQKGHTEFYRGREYTVDLIPKVKLEIVLADDMVEKAVQAIVTSARTGKIGDGKIFLSRIDEAIRIRNEERGNGAL
jgi:nitrogen regulatory protein P-II 1